MQRSRFLLKCETSKPVYEDKQDIQQAKREVQHTNLRLLQYSFTYALLFSSPSLSCILSVNDWLSVV